MMDVEASSVGHGGRVDDDDLIDYEDDDFVDNPSIPGMKTDTKTDGMSSADISVSVAETTHEIAAADPPRPTTLDTLPLEQSAVPLDDGDAVSVYNTEVLEPPLDAGDDIVVDVKPVVEAAAQVQQDSHPLDPPARPSAPPDEIGYEDEEATENYATIPLVEDPLDAADDEITYDENEEAEPTLTAGVPAEVDEQDLELYSAEDGHADGQDSAQLDNYDEAALAEVENRQAGDVELGTYDADGTGEEATHPLDEPETVDLLADEEGAATAMESSGAEALATTAAHDVDGDDEDAASAPDDQNSADQNPRTLPSVTVIYRGDEYPLFSDSSEGDDKMGFFTDDSVLEQNMGGVLAMLRKELRDDIRDDEELVLQLDELGMEYSESSNLSILSDATFRYLLEIFDQLVKNQDKDSSRVLYAYLSTKLSPVKRLMFLINSAYEGSGLNDISHYYRAPGHNEDATMEHGDDDEMQQSASARDTSDGNYEDGEDEYHDEMPDVDDGGQEDDAVDLDGPHADEFNGQQGTDDGHGDTTEPQTANDEEGYDENVGDEQWDNNVEEPSGAEAEGEGGAAAEPFDLQADSHRNDRATGNTSATSTLNGDDAADAAADADADADAIDADDAGSGAPAGNGHLSAQAANPPNSIDDDEEIDWRDDDEKEDEKRSHEVLEESLSVGGKRTRADGDDELLSLDRGQDVKRHRS